MTEDEERRRATHAEKLLRDCSRPERRARATHEMATLGTVAVRLLVTVLDGSARDAFAHPIRKESEVFRCALVAARLLGPVAGPLRALLANTISTEHRAIAVEAIRAIAAVGIEEAEIAAVARALDRSPDVACEAVVARRDAGALGHPTVKTILADSSRARAAVERFKESTTNPR